MRILNRARRRALVVLLIAPTILSCSGIEQDQGDYIMRTADFGGTECAYAIAETPPGDFVVTGSCPGSGMYDENVYVARLSASGEVLGQISYGGKDNDFGRAIAPTPDGGWVIVGATQSAGAGMSDVLLLRLSAGGDSLWSRTYGGTKADEAGAVVVTADSGFFIAGTTKSFGHGNQDAYIIKTDSRGDTIWTRCFGGTEDDYAREVLATTDGGCLIVGSTNSFGAGNSDMYVVRCSAEGDSLWSQTFGSVEYDEANCAVQTSDRGFAIAGATHLDAPAGDMILVRMDQDGTQLWQRTYGSYQGDCALDMAVTPDGGFILTGYYTTPGLPERPISSNAYLVKADSLGNCEWERDFGGVHQECGYGVLTTVNGSYVIVGGVSAIDRSIADILWIKTL